MVPVAGQVWSSDPFTLTARDNRLIGRGTTDMKGFIACALALVPEFSSRNLRVPIHLAFSYDEEVGCLAAPALLEHLKAFAAPPAAAIIGEPSGMRPANAHRGIHAFTTTVSGIPGHSSEPEAGVNAIDLAAACIGFLGQLADNARRQANRDDGDAVQHTTVNVGTIEGGAAVNIIAGHCRFAWDCRPAPGDRAARVRAALDHFVSSELLSRLKTSKPGVAVVTEEAVAVPPLTSEPGSPAEALALALTGHNACVTVPFASEAGHFQEADIPAVVCGPGFPAQAHQPDEFVDVEQIEACLAFLHRLADWATR